MSPYPLQFEPLLKPRVWGGHRLARLRGTAAPAPIGESWELSDLDDVPEGRSRIANGRWRGRELRAVLDDHEDALMGSVARMPGGGFPLLVKLLDAHENLSVQMHPTASYAAAHADAHEKTEAWYILDADPHARLYCGLRDEVDAAEAARALGTEAIVAHLAVRVARRGHCHELPSGTIHALGAGCFAAEFQTPSDTTFRVWDWGRTDRTMHVEEARACAALDMRPPVTVDADERELRAGDLLAAPLVDNARFQIERIRAASRASFELVTNDAPVVIMAIDGRGQLRGGDETVRLEPITTTLVPARCPATIELEPDAVVLRASPADPGRGAIA